MYKKINWSKYFLILFSQFISIAAFAGSPFITGDPEPPDYGQWQLFAFALMNKSYVGSEEPDLFAPAFEADWGPLPNTQLHLTVPTAWTLPTDGVPAARGLGDIETGIKYRFIQESEYVPQVGVFPLLEIPTGDARKDLGNGKAWYQVPIWVQKSWGTWTTYGGGGYVFNPQFDTTNYPFGGWTIEKKFQKLTLGVEAFAQKASVIEGRGFTLLNAGGFYDFTKHFSILFSAGHSIIGETHTVTYFGLYYET